MVADQPASQGRRPVDALVEALEGILRRDTEAAAFETVAIGDRLRLHFMHLRT
jgi:hypothetical protein